jgi:hypothetical protein
MVLERNGVGRGESASAVAFGDFLRVGGAAIYLSRHVFDRISAGARMQWSFCSRGNGTDAAAA